jgi:hypothetical protein
MEISLDFFLTEKLYAWRSASSSSSQRSSRLGDQPPFLPHQGALDLEIGYLSFHTEEP